MDCLDEKSKSEFISMDKILQYLFENGFLSDIECRKIVYTNYLMDRRAAIYYILKSKDQYDFENILNAFAYNAHPIWNQKILRKIFGFLSDLDTIKKCRLVCLKWNVAAESLIETRTGIKFCSLRSNTSGSSVYYELWKNDDQKQNEVTISENVTATTKSVLLHSFCNAENSSLEKLLVDEAVIEKSDSENKIKELIKIRATIFALLVSSYHEEPLKLLALYNNVHPTENSETDAAEIDCPANKAMGIIEVSSPILEHLQFDDIKNLRLVCRQWNYVGEAFLRKRSTMKFTTFFLPRNFMNAFKYFTHASYAITAFEFRNILCVSELANFVQQWGQVIKYLRLWNVNLKSDNVNEEIFTLDISDYFVHIPNLTELYIRSDGHTLMEVSANLLQTIKIISLTDVNFKVENLNRKMRPSTIQLRDVKFVSGGQLLRFARLNEFIDFSEVKKVEIITCYHQDQAFDWTSDTFNAQRFKIQMNRNLRQADQNFLDWSASTAKIDYLELYKYPIRESTTMKIKYLRLQPQGCIFYDHPYFIDLSKLPTTIEKLWIVQNIDMPSQFVTLQAIELPNLSFLSMKLTPKTNSPAVVHPLISEFTICFCLVDLELGMSAGKWIIDVDWLPKSVKRLRLEGEFEFVKENRPQLPQNDLNLDIFVVSGNYATCANLISKLKTKVLVITWVQKSQEETTEDIILFVLEFTKRMEKMIVWRSVYKDWEEKNPFQRSLTSQFVDKKADFYEFVNERGQAITKEKFARHENCFSHHTINYN